MQRRRLLAALGAAALTPADLLGAAARPASGASRTSTARLASTARAVVLGTAQDAGVPQVNCFRDHCARVRAGLAPDPRVACLGLIDDAAGRRFLIDATPDFNAQVQALLAAAGADVQGRSVPLHEQLHGILLTHAHVGHYTGLMELGREIAASRELPVWASSGMCGFLAANAPWDALVRNGNVSLRPLQAGDTVQLSERLQARPFAVAHRAEYTDTFGWIVQGPERALLYVPDADSWDLWPVPFEQLLDQVQLALVDGSFWSGRELGDRPQSEVPHPPVSLTLQRLAGRAGNPPVRFIHLNHTNPLWDEAAAERAALGEGFGVAATGEQHPL